MFPNLDEPTASRELLEHVFYVLLYSCASAQEDVCVDVFVCLHVTMMCMRCIRFAQKRAYKALILTHELTPEGDFDTYLARQLFPVRPLISYGRSAKAWPPCEPKVAVFSWWRDRPAQWYRVEPSATHRCMFFLVIYWC